MNSIRKHILTIFAVLASLSVPSVMPAAPPTLKVSMDSAYVLMGKATPMHIQLVADAADKGNILIPADSMCAGVEILDLLEADTTDLGNGRIEVNREMLLQSFDSGMYQLRPVLYVAGHDTIASQRLALKVIPAMVDSLTTIHDYADVRDVNRKFVDYLPDFLADYGLWLLALVIVLGGGYFVFRRYLARKKPEHRRASPPVPPYEAAKQALMALKSENLCEQGREKDYYTSLTDILRVYLQRRFGINAMEMTSGQIRRTLSHNEQTRLSKQYVDQVLEIADFVKFAKMRPLPDDNIRSFNSALQFVEDTKPAPQPAPDADNAGKDNNIKTKS